MTFCCPLVGADPLCLPPRLCLPACLQDGDTIRIDAETRSMDILNISGAELESRRAAWVAPPLKATRGTLYKYIKCVAPASVGCVTDL